MNVFIISFPNTGEVNTVVRTGIIQHCGEVAELVKTEDLL